MDVVKYSLNNKPIGVCNMYSYLINLFKLKVIPIFRTEIKNKLNELVFIFKNATIIYYVDTKKWKITINDTNCVFETYDINEILKITFELFNKNKPEVIYNIKTVNNNKIHNLNHYTYYMFINNFIKHEQKKCFETYKNNSKHMPEELWCIINKYYEHSDMCYYDFLDTFL
jgi:hypothetical protein